ncbi:hypothetical protein GCM10020001_019870 [Nonomuraea salmonea]
MGGAVGAGGEEGAEPDEDGAAGGAVTGPAATSSGSAGSTTASVAAAATTAAATASPRYTTRIRISPMRERLGGRCRGPATRGRNHLGTVDLIFPMEHDGSVRHIAAWRP